MDDRTPQQPSFVDSLWRQLHETMEPRVEKRLRAFVRQRGVTKWVIATDFCIDEPTRPNDSFAFVIFPAGSQLQETQRQLERIPARDLKEVQRPPERLIRLLRKGRVFTLCFVADRSRRLFPDVVEARRSLDVSIEMMEHWGNAAECEQIIRQFRAMRTELDKKSVSLKLLTNIILTTAFVSYIAALLCRLGHVEQIGWAPDRDKITGAYRGISTLGMFPVNVSALCQQFGVPEPLLSILSKRNDDLWCDHFIRVADYVAGAAAAWDLAGKQPVSLKIATLIRHTFPNNPYLFIFPITFGTVDGQFLCRLTRLSISTRPPSHQKYRAGLKVARGGPHRKKNQKSK